MPAVLQYVPPTDQKRQTFSGQVEKERSRRRDAYKKAIQYYEGEHTPMLDFKPKEGDEVDDNVFINLVKMTCDRTSSFLFSAVPIVQTDISSAEDTDEETWIKEFLEVNGGLHLLTKLAIRGFLSGHNFVGIVPPTKTNKGYPRINLLDPLSITIFWKADDETEVVWYEQRILVGNEIHLYDYVHDLENDTWTIHHFVTETGHAQNDYEVAVETITAMYYSSYNEANSRINFEVQKFKVADAPVKFPDVGIAPIIEIPHLPNPISRYGNDEFGLEDLQDTVNLIASLRNQVAREVGVPVDVAIGVDADEVDFAEDIITISNPNAKLQRLELKGDIVGVTSMLEKLMEIYLSIARVVILKGEAKDLQRVTNASVRTLFLDQISKNNILQSSYGRGMKQIIELALKMSGKPFANKDQKLTIKWASPLPTDFTELAKINSIMVAMGARSKQTASTEMGDSWAFEKQAMANEREEDMANQEAQMELMQNFAPEPSEDSPNSSKDKAPPDTAQKGKPLKKS